MRLGWLYVGMHGTRHVPAHVCVHTQPSPLPSQVPFNLSCGQLGRLRWVTTSIYRLDLNIPWPTDLDCQLKWNTGLTSFDGATASIPCGSRVKGQGLGF